MRVQPHIWAAKDKRTPESFIIDVVRNAICTHGHPRGIFGAVFHAQCLAKSLESGETAGPDFWRWSVEYFPRIVDLIKNDSELSSFWLPVWERLSNKSISVSMEQIRREFLEDLAIVEKYLPQDTEIGYRQMVEALGCLKANVRGSGTKTAIIASALAWMKKDEHPSKALEIASNLLFSDTDTIASMAGAIMGSVTRASFPDNSLLDQEYITGEAMRLNSISTGQLQVSFSYPDLLRWQPPKTQLDSIGLVNNQTAVAGLGIVEALDKAFHSRSRNEFYWQMMRLDFGQSLICKRRLSLSPLPAGNVPPKERFSGPLHRAIGHGGNDGFVTKAVAKASAKQTQTVRSQPPMLDELTKETINSGFDPIMIGNNLLRFAERQDGIEQAIAYTAIVVKAKRARLNKDSTP
jgi:hypothetical protein